MPTRLALIAALALLLAGCSSKPPEADTAEVTPDPAVIKPATPASKALPAPKPEERPDREE